MFRISCPVLAIALIGGGLSVQTAGAQVPVPGLEPHVDLTATLDTGPGDTAFSKDSKAVRVYIGTPPAPHTGKLFNDPPPAEGGWKGLAKLLEALTPSVDTEIPLTASQITSRISSMLDRGQNQEAFDVIQKRMAQNQARGGMGTDVQLLFLHARALAVLGRQDEAIESYRQMTTLYPELPEPWNNLAAEYVKQGKLEMAQDALAMALAANPDYGTARANMGEVQLLLARQSFQGAAQLGVGGAQGKAEATTNLLKK
ncbi:tetratricopeptide repeat protein [Candidimonas sp. SYP-B2681]|uniref:tetratricopeptide repeat protein n=1 Tax=Candidimonas sp. SYP-B2681 TaxID=2497686 RepID=UPI000F898D4C|nr:tetratricopeptide repeat protein [Candidimonas sp. SYP-B2681]RTZ44574.1 tetratricopeptide repeat protein [Candidimonas sp. SYP-B2681]